MAGIGDGASPAAGKKYIDREKFSSIVNELERGVSAAEAEIGRIKKSSSEADTETWTMLCEVEAKIAAMGKIVASIKAL